ncbi:MFS transporter [Puerhibacterium sp. TATVAM-FAB25]|uniref:MFS transporter n=1 Tax=Puerhibacterium sp. TATVAM-FAB25 TaxID=3093699 RepID=UPI00397CF35A
MSQQGERHAGAAGTAERGDGEEGTSGRGERGPRGAGRPLAAVFVAQTATYVALGGVVAVALPLLVAAAAPESKESALGVLAALSSLVTAACIPALGALADRSRSPWGRRAPWAVVGGAVGGLAVVALPLVQSVVWLAVWWVLAQVALNAVDGAAAGAVADDVPAGRRGTASAALSLGAGFGSGLGVVLVGALAASPLAAVAAAGAVAALGALAFPLVRGRGAGVLEAPVGADADAPARPAGVLAGFGTVAHDPHLRRIFVARVLVVLGNHGVTTYQLYILADHVGMPLTQAARVSALLVPAHLVAVVLGGVVVGRLADRLPGKHRLTAAAAAALAIAALVPVASPSLAAVVVFATVGGLAHGAFLTVQTAETFDALPDRRTAGRELGVVGVATTGTQAVAPLFAVALLQVGVGYASVFVALAVLAGSAAVLSARVPVSSGPRHRGDAADDAPTGGAGQARRLASAGPSRNDR